jgi:hypothetical protein
MAVHTRLLPFVQWPKQLACNTPQPRNPHHLLELVSLAPIPISKEVKHLTTFTCP